MEISNWTFFENREDIFLSTILSAHYYGDFLYPHAAIPLNYYKPLITAGSLLTTVFYKLSLLTCRGHQQTCVFNSKSLLRKFKNNLTSLAEFRSQCMTPDLRRDWL